MYLSKLTAYILKKPLSQKPKTIIFVNPLITNKNVPENSANNNPEMGKNKESPTPQEEDDEDEQDIISTSIGEYGRWQLQLTCVLAFFNLPCTWHIYSPTFQADRRDLWCARPSDLPNVDPFLWKNITQPKGPCSILDYKSVNYTMDDISNITHLSINKLIGCDRWEFNGEGETIISEFSLVCDRKQLTNVAEMMFLAGVAIGGIVCGWFSDKYGRKRVLMFSVLVQTIIGIVIAFAPNFEMYIVLRAILGFISVSVVFSGFVLAIELVGGIWRTVAGVCYLIPLALSYITIAGIGWLLPDWRHLQLAISVPGIFFVALWRFLPESPRWLLAMGKTKELMVVLEGAALVNERQLPNNLDKQLLPNSMEPVESVGIMDLFRTPKMRKITILLLMIWFVIYLVYYGLVLNVSNIGGDIYLNSVIGGLVEIPADIISLVFLLKMGRRWPFLWTFIVCGVSCLLTLPIPDAMQWLITTFAMFGKFCISASNVIIPVYTAELYPTTIRNIGVGASNVSAGIALMLVPYLWELVIIFVMYLFMFIFVRPSTTGNIFYRNVFRRRSSCGFRGRSSEDSA